MQMQFRKCWQAVGPALACALVFLVGAVSNAQDKADPKRMRVVRGAPSAVAPTPRYLAAAAAVTASLLAAAVVTSVLRARRRKAVPVLQTAEVIPVVVPVNAPVVLLVQKPIFVLPDEPVRWTDIADDVLPGTFSARELGKTTVVAIPVMEGLARALQAARNTNTAGSRLYRKLLPVFVGVDDNGALWSIGTKTATWYRLEADGWMPRLPPQRVFLADVVFQKLIDLQAAFASPR